MLRAVLVDVGGTLGPDCPTLPLPDETFLSQLLRLLPAVEPARSLAALRAAMRQDDTSLVQNTHAVLGRAIQRLGAECTDADLVAVRRALCAPASPAVSLFAGAADSLKVCALLGFAASS